MVNNGSYWLIMVNKDSRVNSFILGNTFVGDSHHPAPVFFDVARTHTICVVLNHGNYC